VAAGALHAGSIIDVLIWVKTAISGQKWREWRLKIAYFPANFVEREGVRSTSAISEASYLYPGFELPFYRLSEDYYTSPAANFKVPNFSEHGWRDVAVSGDL
jgi:hypothetical protein